MNVRDWIIHVEDQCAAIVAVLFEGKLGNVHDFGGNSEMPNLEVNSGSLRQTARSHLFYY